MAWKPGQTGNPKGNKRARIITQQLVSVLNEIDPADGISNLRKVVDALVKNAKAGDNAAIAAVMDRVEGKPPQFSTGDADEFRKAMDLTDDELAAIAAGGSDGAASAESNPPVTH